MAATTSQTEFINLKLAIDQAPRIRNCKSPILHPFKDHNVLYWTQE